MIAPDKIEEALMDDKYDEELEETEKLVSHVQSSPSLEDDDNTKETGYISR
jgi:hypothetical protein